LTTIQKGDRLEHMIKAKNQELDFFRKPSSDPYSLMLLRFGPDSEHKTPLHCFETLNLCDPHYTFVKHTTFDYCPAIQIPGKLNTKGSISLFYKGLFYGNFLDLEAAIYYATDCLSDNLNALRNKKWQDYKFED
jgi:hypothetical protein